MAKDFYSILGVPRGSSEADIKQAYRKLSRELHPDKHKGDKEKEAKFKAVNEAYDVLSDAKKKQAYDQFGSTDGSSPFGGGGGGGGGFGGFDPGNIDPSAFGQDFGDIFETFFGGARGGGRRQSDSRGRTVEVEKQISFADAVKGAQIVVEFSAQSTCSECSGGGSAAGSKTVSCKECGGTGSIARNVRSLFGTIRQNVVCDTCKGSGKVPEKPCKRCGGEGRTQERRSVTVNVPAGIDDGQALRVTSEGEAGRQGSASGDLLVRMRVVPDARFERGGDDIRSSHDIPLTTAVLGDTITVETVHGPANVVIAAGTQSGQVLRIKGKGMPIVNTSRTGDHYVTINISVPHKLSKEQRKLYEQLKALE